MVNNHDVKRHARVVKFPLGCWLSRLVLKRYSAVESFTDLENVLFFPWLLYRVLFVSVAYEKNKISSAEAMWWH